MSENTDNTPRYHQDEQKAKLGRPTKGVKVTNKSSRLITLIATRTEKVSILPTETKELSKEFMAEIKNNIGAMAFFECGFLVEG